MSTAAEKLQPVDLTEVAWNQYEVRPEGKKSMLSKVLPRSSMDTFLKTGKKPLGHYGGDVLLRDEYQIGILHKQALYGVWSRYSGSLFSYLEQKPQFTEDTTPGAVIIKCSSRVKELLSKYRNILLINADNEKGGNFHCPDFTYEYWGEEGFPLVSFACLCEMQETDMQWMVQLLGGGKIVLLDFSPEERRKLTSRERATLKKASRSQDTKDLPNFGMKPPELGFMLLRYAKPYSWHRSGSTLFKYEAPAGHLDAYYLFGQDEGTYFGCELSKPCRTIAEAYESLVPAEILGRRDVVRQGEWFCTPVKEKDVPEYKDCILHGDSTISLPILEEGDNRHRLDSTDWRVGKDGLLYALNPIIRHAEHVNVDRSGWYTFYRNTAKRSVSVEGVD